MSRLINRCKKMVRRWGLMVAFGVFLVGGMFLPAPTAFCVSEAALMMGVFFGLPMVHLIWHEANRKLHAKLSTMRREQADLQAVVMLLPALRQRFELQHPDDAHSDIEFTIWLIKLLEQLNTSSQEWRVPLSRDPNQVLTELPGFAQGCTSGEIKFMGQMVLAVEAGLRR